MKENFHQFYVGDFKCIAVNDCYGLTIKDSPKHAFANASNEELAEAARKHGFDPDQWEREAFMHCLLIDTGSRKILFDVGMGTPTLYPGSGKLRSSLLEAGITAEEVDTIIFTHGHWDHVAGLSDDTGNFLFPNAQYMMQKEEWAFWTKHENINQLNPNHAQFDTISFERIPLINDRILLYDPEEEIFPGIRAINVPGHTLGHTAFSIISQNQKLLHISDLVHSHLHFEYPQWHHEVDIRPEFSEASRRKVFSHAAEENLLVFGCHTNSSSGLGYIKPNEDAWRWHPYSL
ncbi:MAG: MBL fold metallo-hydrolase [Chloroflexota bacterium]